MVIILQSVNKSEAFNKYYELVSTNVKPRKAILMLKDEYGVSEK